MLIFLFLVCGGWQTSAQPWQGFSALALAPDGRTFGTGGREGEVLWWETTTGELLGRWVLPPGLPVVALSFDQGAETLTAVTLDGTPTSVVLVEGRLASGAPGSVRRPLPQFRPVSAPVIVSSGDLWIQGTSDGKITVKPSADGNPLASWQAHISAVTGLALAPDGSFLISCSYDGGLARWDPRTGRLLGRL